MSALSVASSELNIPVRFVTAASLFDGHDASINIMRRILQDRGIEVIHLGHDRSVGEIVKAAIEEDVHGIAISSYQGGHMEFFTYMVDLLKEAGREEIKVFGGGGGTITDKEIQELHVCGVCHIYSVEDGRQMGLVGMIDHMIAQASRPQFTEIPTEPPLGFNQGNPPQVARVMSWIEGLYAYKD
jgi:methylmalonyl-CoA mutase